MISTRGWVWLSIIFSSIWIWYATLTIGFFHTILWITMGGVLGGLYSRYRENN